MSHFRTARSHYARLSALENVAIIFFLVAVYLSHVHKG